MDMSRPVLLSISRVGSGFGALRERSSIRAKKLQISTNFTRISPPGKFPFLPIKRICRMAGAGNEHSSVDPQSFELEDFQDVDPVQKRNNKWSGGVYNRILSILQFRRRKPYGFERLGTQQNGDPEIGKVPLTHWTQKWVQYGDRKFHDEQKLPIPAVGLTIPGQEAGVQSLPPGDGVHSEKSALWFYRQVVQLMDLGVKRQLKQEDLPSMCNVDKTERLYSQFAAHLQDQQGSVLGAAWSLHGAKFVLAGVIKVVHDVITFIRPYLLQLLLKELELWEQAAHTSQSGGFLFPVVGLSLGLFCATIVIAMLANLYFFNLSRLSLRLKSQLIQLIYSKSLRITLSAKSQKGTGSIVNHTASDAVKAGNSVQSLHSLWSAPFRVLCVLGMLVRVVGWEAAFAGFVATVALVPVNLGIAQCMEQTRRSMLTHTDARVSLISELIAGIKAIKLYAWESLYKTRISKVRALELRELRRSAFLEEVTFMVFSLGPILVSLAAFAVYSATGRALTASVAFPALALFNMLEFPISMMPRYVRSFIQAQVAYKRITGFMAMDEVGSSQKAASSLAHDCGTAAITSGSFSWSKDQTPVLRDVSLAVKRGQLVVLVGESGGGKSSILSAFLGEMHKQNGTVDVNGSVAYTAQDPWLPNDTVKNIITMGRPFDEALYTDVLECCALNPDLAALPDGDNTEIGERGINLSGGQKHRMAFARACYTCADIYLMDDPFSAVDGKVGCHVFEKCLCGLLEGKTRILVTHQLHFLPMVDIVCVVNKGSIESMGTYQDLVDRGVVFNRAWFEESNEQDGPPALCSRLGGDFETDSSSIMRPTASAPDATKVGGNVLGNLSGQLIKEEEMAIGKVGLSVYLEYFKAWGPFLLLPVLLCVCNLGKVGLQAGQSWWLSVWSSQQHSGDAHYLVVYSALGAASIVCGIMGAMLLLFGSLNASKMFMAKLVEKVVHQPMSFFETRPSGRILNRFSKDIEAIDTDIGPLVSKALVCFLTTTVALIIVSSVTKVLVVGVIVLGFYFLRVQKRYIAGTRAMKRLNSVNTSHVYSHLTETLQGLSTVRAFERMNQFSGKYAVAVDEANRSELWLMMAARWLSVRLEGVSALLVFFTALVSSWSLLRTQSGLVGLALTSAMNLTSLMAWLVQQMSDLELGMNSVERVVEFTSLQSENDRNGSVKRPPDNWPQSGSVIASNLWVRYRPELEPVLKGVSFEIRDGEKIGICGRTGSGKTTLMMALCRIIDPYFGRVMIDGVDTATIGLQSLRSRISVVPQDPVIFSGTIRANLDPNELASSEKELWDAIGKCGLEEFVDQAMGGLDAPILEGGANLSVGQRQLLCMARALLRKSKIVLLDEATSGVDSNTDAVIQDAIQSAFRDQTVLTIAHRLTSIMDYDRIMVMENGTIREFDKPQVLLMSEDSWFRSVLGDASVQI